jgi:putative transposase
VSKNCAEDLAYTRGCGSTLHLFVASVLGWLQREQHEIIQYLREENRVLKVQLGGSRIRLTDAQRRRLARWARLLGRRLLMQVATIVTADTIHRWHRQLIACKWTYSRIGRREGPARSSRFQYRASST